VQQGDVFGMLMRKELLGGSGRCVQTTSIKHAIEGCCTLVRL